MTTDWLEEVKRTIDGNEAVDPGYYSVPASTASLPASTASAPDENANDVGASIGMLFLAVAQRSGCREAHDVVNALLAELRSQPVTRSNTAAALRRLDELMVAAEPEALHQNLDGVEMPDRGAHIRRRAMYEIARSGLTEEQAVAVVRALFDEIGTWRVSPENHEKAVRRLYELIGAVS